MLLNGMKRIVYIVRNECLTPTSSYNEIIMVTESIKEARICLETCKNDTVLQIDKGEHEGFPEDYVLEYDNKVNHLYSRADNQICFSNKEGYYDIYWIEEHELV